MSPKWLKGVNEADEQQQKIKSPMAMWKNQKKLLTSSAFEAVQYRRYRYWIFIWQTVKGIFVTPNLLVLIIN